MPDLRNEPTLNQSDEATAIMPVVTDNSNAGKPRKTRIATQLAAAQSRVRPVKIEAEQVTLVEYSGINASNRALQDGSANNLASSQSFDAGYFAFGFLFEISADGYSNENADGDDPLLISEPNWNASRSNSRIYINKRDQIWRIGATRFALDTAPAQTDEYFLKAIYGYQYTISR